MWLWLCVPAARQRSVAMGVLVDLTATSTSSTPPHAH